MLKSVHSRITHHASRITFYVSRFTLRQAQGRLFHVSRFTSHVSQIAILFFLPFLFFWRLFAPNLADRMWLPAGDLTEQYFPLRVFAAREIAAGRLPLWNPHMFAGQPGLADPQMAALYPLNLLTDLILALLNRPFTFAIFQLQIVLHYSLAAIFTYAFARRLTGNHFAAGVAALVFTFGGYLISYPAQQPTILASAVWLPLVLLLLDGAAERLTPTPALPRPAQGAGQGRVMLDLACAGAAMAMSILAGHPQTFIYVFYTAVAYWIFKNFRFQTVRHTLDPPKAGGLRPRRGPASDGVSNLRQRSGALALKSGRQISSFIPCAARLSSFAFFALALSAVQWLPTLEFTRLSTRAQLNYAYTSTGFALHEIATVIMPGFFGGSPLYVGIIPLLLACAAFTVHRSLFTVHRSPFTVFWLLLALISLFLSLGDSSFLYSFFYLLVPGFAQVRDQERIAFLWSFALSMLAAIGAAQLSRSLSRVRRAQLGIVEKIFGWFMVALVILIALAYLGALASDGTKINLFPGALHQLVPDFFWLLAAWVLWRLRLYTPLRRPLLMLAALAVIGLNLFSVNGTYNFQKPTPADYFPETALTRALKAELQANPLARVASEGLLPGGHNAGADFDFEEVSGNDPLQLRVTAEFDQQVQELRKWQLLGVQYVISKRNITHGAFAPLASEGDVHLYRYYETRPRAWLVHAARTVAAEKIFEALNSAEFDPATTALLYTPSPIDLPLSAPTDSQAEIVEHTAGQLRLRTRSTANALLVLSEIDYAGWQVTIDGQRATPLTADGVLMAIAVPSGSHGIELTFQPDWVKIGAAISVISALLWLGLLAAAYKSSH